MLPGKDYIGVGVGAFIVNEKQELLLLKRRKAPEKGCWCIPGGKIEMFEKIEEAVIRETKEETNLNIQVIKLMGICDHIVSEENAHWVAASYLCEVISGEPTLMEPAKASEIRWFPLDQLPENTTITTKKALEDYIKMEK